MEKMRTAEEMLAYVGFNGTGCGGKREENLASFKVIEKHLQPDEDVAFAFMTFYYITDFSMNGIVANAVTSKRILMAKANENSVFKTIPRDELRSMTMSRGKYFVSLIFDSKEMQIQMQSPADEAVEIERHLTATIEELGFGVNCPKPLSQDRFQIMQREATDIKKLVTAKDMVQFCKMNNALDGLREKKAQVHFEIIEECLEEGEPVMEAFITRHYYKDLGFVYFANAISDRRILMSCYGRISGRLLKFISFDELETVRVETEGGLAYIQFRSRKMKVDMEAPLYAGEQVRAIFVDILRDPAEETAAIESGMEESLQDGRSSAAARGMRTAEKMLQYCIDHGTIGEWRPRKRLPDFEMAADCMEKDEYAIMCFMGVYSETNLKGLDSWYVRVKEKDNRWLCAFTNKRIIMTQKSIPPGRFISIPYERLYDVSIGISDPYANVIISTVNGDMDIHMDAGQGYQVRGLLNDVREQVPEFGTVKRERQAETCREYSTADELKKYKELLDEGAITEADYEEIKKKLLIRL